MNFSRSVVVIRKALEGGVNLVDSHPEYHGGLSEVAVGRALKGWKGHRVYLQTKTPFYQDRPLDYFKRLLEQALEKMGVSTIDYLLNHALRLDMFKRRIRKFFKFTDWAMKRGLIRFRGFSSHDTPENVKRFIDTGEFSCCLLSFNWMNPTMTDTIAYAADRGLGVAIMNPVGGGSLAAVTPQILRLLPGARSSAEVALRYVLSTPGVTQALSGMSTVEQVAENVRIAGRSTAMTLKQRAAMLKRLASIQRKTTRICTLCGYCMPCPHGVDIRQNFLLLQRARLFGLMATGRDGFRRLKNHPDGDQSALACRQCGRCLPKCPNDVPIIEQLAETATLLG